MGIMGVSRRFHEDCMRFPKFERCTQCQKDFNGFNWKFMGACFNGPSEIYGVSMYSLGLGSFNGLRSVSRGSECG